MLEHHEVPEQNTQAKKGLSNDMIDGITITVLILVITAGVAYWLSSMTIA